MACLEQVNASCHSACVQTHPMSLLHSRTVSVHLFRFNQRAHHTHAHVGSPSQTYCLLFSRGQRLLGLQSTQSGPVFAQQHSTSLGASTCYLCTTSRRQREGRCTCSCPLHNNTLISRKSLPNLCRLVRHHYNPAAVHYNLCCSVHWQVDSMTKIVIRLVKV